MKSVAYKTIAVLALFGASFFTHASLIINGGFEANDIDDKSWSWFKAEDVAGWEGSHIEIWDSLQKFDSYEGEQHAELNAHRYKGVYSIFQTFETSLTDSYEVSFAYAARRKSDAFKFSIFNGFGNTLFSQVFNDHKIKEWSTFGTLFSADTFTTTIMFTSLNSGTLGNFLDDVKVIALPKITSNANPVDVPEPKALIAVLLASLLILAGRRKSVSK